MAPTRRHHMLNSEWWTPARKLKGYIIAIGAIAFAVSMTFGAIDLINNRCVQPDFQRRFDICNKPHQELAERRYKETIMRSMRIDCGIEAIMDEQAKAKRDSAFRRDSINYERGMAQRN